MRNIDDRTTIYFFMLLKKLGIKTEPTFHVVSRSTLPYGSSYYNDYFLLGRQLAPGPGQ